MQRTGDVHCQACLFFSHLVVDSWKLVKKYVCPRTEKNVPISIIFVPLCFSGLSTVLSMFKLPENTYSDYIKKKKKEQLEIMC